jgi:hypothetical protein
MENGAVLLMTGAAKATSRGISGRSYNTAMQPFVKKKQKKLPAEKTLTIPSEPPFSPLWRTS